jgi:hypothetical protein
LAPRFDTITKLTAPKSVKVRWLLTLRGSVAPASVVGQVTIVKTRKVGKKWKSMGTAKVTLVGGAYKYAFKPKARGTWRFVARFGGRVVGPTTYTASRSATRSVKVK